MPLSGPILCVQADFQRPELQEFLFWGFLHLYPGMQLVQQYPYTWTGLHVTHSDPFWGPLAGKLPCLHASFSASTSFGTPSLESGTWAYLGPIGGGGFNNFEMISEFMSFYVWPLVKCSSRRFPLVPWKHFSKLNCGTWLQFFRCSGQGQLYTPLLIEHWAHHLLPDPPHRQHFSQWCLSHSGSFLAPLDHGLVLPLPFFNIVLFLVPTAFRMLNLLQKPCLPPILRRFLCLTCWLTCISFS